MNDQGVKRVLIAHQSSIPHYRVRFYELLEQRRPREWSFDVVYDVRESERPTVFQVRVDHQEFSFPILPVRTRTISVAGRKLLWQNFLRAARSYDVVVTDTYVANLAYLFAYFLKLWGVKRVLWGLTRDMNVTSMTPAKKLAENAKQRLISLSDHFLAYTEGGKSDLIERGYPAEKITVLNNTVDIVTERNRCLRYRPQRDAIRREMGVADKNVIVYVGRLNRLKRIDLLVKGFTKLNALDPSYYLFVVGGGESSGQIVELAKKLGPSAVTYFGPANDDELVGRIFTASDLYVLTGQIGLAPLTAFCYDLPAIVFDLPIHSSEVEYLDRRNSVFLPGDTNASQLAERIPQIYEQFSSQETRREIFESIRHLTMEAMVDNYISGINKVLRL